MDFIAVDFETPNWKNDSICAMGITLVENSKVVFNREILVNPHARFDARNIEVHGISRDDVQGCPSFAEIWEEYYLYFNHYPVVMHNATFDKNVLEKAAKREHISLPPIDYYCTMALCKANYKFEHYNLPSVCDEFGITLENHHNAASDSLATAKIMLKLMEDRSNTIASIDHMYCYRYEYHGQSAEEREVSAPSLPPIEENNYVLPSLDFYNGEFNFCGKVFLLTGQFYDMSRKDIKEQIEEVGGKVTSTFGKKVDYLVVGLEDLNLVKGPSGKSTKILEAEAAQRDGHKVKIIKYDRFIQKLQEEKLC